MKAYLSKYALTKGIIEVEGNININVPTVLSAKVNGKAQYYQSNDWHTSKEEALKRAEDMRVRQIELLKKQIEKLENINFLNLH